jgi:hypothetical protein
MYISVHGSAVGCGFRISHHIIIVSPQNLHVNNQITRKLSARISPAQ